MRVLKLPDRPEFRAFQTEGPSGNHAGDINGRAAAIECYLDVGAAPLVRWTTYNRELDVYQGELVGKADFMKRFLEVVAVDDSYDFSKISTIVQVLVSECGSMREAFMLADLKKEIEGLAEGAQDDQ